MSPIVGMESDLELEALREANLALRERSKGLARELMDITQVFDKSSQGYNAVISIVNEALI